MNKAEEILARLIKEGFLDVCYGKPNGYYIAMDYSAMNISEADNDYLNDLVEARGDGES